MKKLRGFTLIEILLALGIFSVASIVAIGAVVVLLGSYNKTQSTQVLVDSLNFAVESMTREVRFGENYSSNGTSIEVDFEGDRITYARNGDGRLERRKGSDVTFLTASGIFIDDFTVVVEGEVQNDLLHPRATFLLEGSLAVGNKSSEFALQTSASQRAGER